MHGGHWVIADDVSKRIMCGMYDPVKIGSIVSGLFTKSLLGFPVPKGRACTAMTVSCKILIIFGFRDGLVSAYGFAVAQKP